MSRRAVIAASIIAVVCAAALGVLYFVWHGGASFDESFRDACLKNARGVTDAKGIPWREVEAAHRRMCNCGLDVFKVMPASEQQALQTSEEKRQAFAAEVQRRCN